MRYLVKKVKGEIREVLSIEYYKRRLKTEEEVLGEVSMFNDRHREEGIVYETFEADGIMAETLDFFLGENAYERAQTLTDLCDRLEEVKAALEEIESDVSDETWNIGHLCKNIEKVIAKRDE